MSFNRWRSLVDGTEIGGIAIPETGLDHLWWGPSISDVSIYTDVEGSLDMSSVDSPQLSDINGNQSVSYDGTDDAHTVGSSLTLGSGGAYTAVIVVDPTDDSRQQAIVSMGSSSSTTAGYDFQLRFDTSGYQISHTGVDSATGGSIIGGPQVLVFTYNGSNVILDANGSEIINTSISAPDPPQARTDIAQNSAFASFTNGVIGAYGHEAAAADATRRDNLTNQIADAFDITI